MRVCRASYHAANKKRNYVKCNSMIVYSILTIPRKVNTISSIFRMPPDNLRQYIGKAFEQAIHRRRISKTAAARDLDVSRQMLYLYLKGRSLPDESVLRRACAAWDLELNFEGLIVNSSSFRQPALDVTSAVQLPLDLRQALDQLRDENLKIHIVRKENGRVEMNVVLQFGT